MSQIGITLAVLKITIVYPYDCFSPHSVFWHQVISIREKIIRAEPLVSLITTYLTGLSTSFFQGC